MWLLVGPKEEPDVEGELEVAGDVLRALELEPVLELDAFRLYRFAGTTLVLE
jgi:hypothetical protein